MFKILPHCHIRQGMVNFDCFFISHGIKYSGKLVLLGKLFNFEYQLKNIFQFDICVLFQKFIQINTMKFQFGEDIFISEKCLQLSQINHGLLAANKN